MAVWWRIEMGPTLSPRTCRTGGVFFHQGVAWTDSESTVAAFTSPDLAGFDVRCFTVTEDDLGPGSDYVRAMQLHDRPCTPSCRMGYGHSCEVEQASWDARSPDAGWVKEAYPRTSKPWSRHWSQR